MDREKLAEELYNYSLTTLGYTVNTSLLAVPEHVKLKFRDLVEFVIVKHESER